MDKIELKLIPIIIIFFIPMSYKINLNVLNNAVLRGYTNDRNITLDKVMEMFNTRGPMDSRDREQNKKPQIVGNTFFPLINIDKQGVKELYEKFGLLDTLYPLTRSCESFTDDFSKHCGEYKDEQDVCWFCKERYWGFGRYV